MIVGKLFNLVNEGEYKVLYLFGWKIRFCSRIRALRVRITELEEKQQRLEKKLQQQKQEYSQAAQRLESMLVTQEKHILELQQQIRSGLSQAASEAEQLSASIAQNKVEMEDRLQELAALNKEQGQKLAATCRQYSESTDALARRVKALEKLELAAACAYNREATEAVTQRVEALEKLELAVACARNRETTEILSRRMTAFEGLALPEKVKTVQALTEKTEQSVQQVARNVLQVEQKLQQMTETQREYQSATEQHILCVSEHNKTEIATVSQRLGELEKQDLADVCARNRETTEILSMRMTAFEGLALPEKVKTVQALTEKTEQRVKQVETNLKSSVEPLQQNVKSIKAGLEEVGEFRDAVRNHVMRSTFMGKELRGWPQSFMQRIIGQYRTLDYEPRSRNRVIVYMTDKNTTCGLADRLRTMLTAYVLAAESGREFYIYHDKGFKLEDYLQPNQVSWKINPEDISFGLNKVHTIFLLRKYIDLSAWSRECHVYQSCTDVDTDFMPAELAHKYSNHSVFHKLFKISPILRTAAQQEMRELGLRKNGYVAVHIRFLNFFEQVELSGCVTSTATERLEMLKNVSLTLEKIHRETKKKVVLFSDSNTVLQVQYPEYVKVLRGTVGHVSTHNGNADIVKKAFVDMLVMSRARTVYSIVGKNIYEATESKYGGQRNGFSKTAAYIGNVPFVRYQISEHS